MKTTLMPLLVAGLLALAACQSAQEGESYTANQEKELAQFLQKEKLSVGEPAKNLFNFMINGFKPVNDMNLLVYAGVRDTYLVKLVQPCFDLRHAITVRLDSYSSVLDSFDHVIIGSPFNMRQVCMIDSILKLSPVKDVPGNAEPKNQGK